MCRRRRLRGWRRGAESNRRIKVLQTSALPLGYRAILCDEILTGPLTRETLAEARAKVWSGRRDLNPRLRPWQGRTLPLSYSRSTRSIIGEFPRPVKMRDGNRISPLTSSIINYFFCFCRQEISQFFCFNEPKSFFFHSPRGTFVPNQCYASSNSPFEVLSLVFEIESAHGGRCVPCVTDFGSHFECE